MRMDGKESIKPSDANKCLKLLAKRKYHSVSSIFLIKYSDYENTDVHCEKLLAIDVSLKIIK